MQIKRAFTMLTLYTLLIMAGRWRVTVGSLRWISNRSSAPFFPDILFLFENSRASPIFSKCPVFPDLHVFQGVLDTPNIVRCPVVFGYPVFRISWFTPEFSTCSDFPGLPVFLGILDTPEMFGCPGFSGCHVLLNFRVFPQSSINSTVFAGRSE